MSKWAFSIHIPISSPPYTRIPLDTTKSKDTTESDICIHSVSHTFSHGDTKNTSPYRRPNVESTCEQKKTCCHKVESCRKQKERERGSEREGREREISIKYPIHFGGRQGTITFTAINVVNRPQIPYPI